MANAQVISFSEEAAKGSLNGKTFGTDGFVLTVNDPKGEKVQIDANSQYFGTADKYTSYAYRMKTNGKSSSSNSLSLTIPSDGTLNVCVRTASSSDATRNVIFQQDGAEILNQTLNDADAVKATIEGEEKNVFPIYSCPVKAGTVDITYPVNAVNFYAFELVSASSDAYEFSASTTPDFGEWVIDQTYFPAAEIATKLGLADAAALYELINTGTAFYLELPDGTRTNEGFSDKNQPWMNAQGVNQGYGDEGTCWFAGIAAEDAEDGTPSVNAWIGDMPNFFKTVYTDSDLTAKFYLVNGDKEVAFIFKLHVDAAPEPVEIADPATSFAALEVVKEYEMTLDYTEGKKYEGQTTTIDVADMCEALGTSEAAISSNIEKILAYQTIVTNESGSVEFSDSLAYSRGSTDGWFGRYTTFDEATGEEYAIAQNGPKQYGTGCTFYLQNPKFADGQFSIVNGQYPGTMKAGDTDYAVIYLLNGNKAAKITVKVNIAEAAKIDFSEMTKVGEQEINADPLEVANAYTSVLASFDVNDILTKLGCTASDLIAYNYADEEYKSVVDPTENDYWLSETGISQAWSTSPCCQLKADLANGTATLLQMNGKYYSIEESKTFPMYYILAYGANYYVLKFNFTLKPVGQISGEPECVATESVVKQIIPGDDWPVDGRYQLDREYIESIIGTTNFTIYGDVYNEKTNALEFTKDYSCYDTTNKGWGFWYGTTTVENEEHQVVVWDEKWGCSSTNSFGFQLFPDYSIGFFQYPGQRSVGDEYTANIYLMNEENGKYIKFIVTVKYVEEITPETEVVGTESAVFKASEEIVDADGYYSVTPDLSKAFEALGLTAADIESAQIVAPKTQYTYGYYDAEEQILYASNGYVAFNEDDAAYAAFLSIAEDGTPTIKIDDIAGALEATDAAKIVVRIGLEYDGKRYMHEIILANEAAYTSVNNVKTAATASTIYTIAGAKVNSLQKGINIVKMTDGQVKKVYVK